MASLGTNLKGEFMLLGYAAIHGNIMDMRSLENTILNWNKREKCEKVFQVLHGSNPLLKILSILEI